MISHILTELFERKCEAMRIHIFSRRPYKPMVFIIAESVDRISGGFIDFVWALTGYTNTKPVIISLR